jgi:two-component system response regulator AtoC
MTFLTISQGENRNNRFVVTQAESSAQMVSQMVRDEMRRGHFSHVEARVSRIEELVKQGYLTREVERELLLLAAQFLEGAGQTKRAFRFAGLLVADVDTLPKDIYIDLRRFRTRLLLNVGQVGEARAEVTSIDRLVLRSDGAFGDTKETIDADTSSVTLATWLLTAEVCLAEGNPGAAIQALREGFACMQRDGQSAEEAVMFELSSALACFVSGDSEGVPALAYLYRVHVVLDSGIDAAIRARIAAACGDMERTAGLSANEAVRWRSSGPDRTMIERYLGEGEVVVPPSDLLKRMLPVQLGVAGSVTEVTQIQRRPIARDAAERVAPITVPLAFLFESFGLEKITSMFDFNLDTGPLVIDWSACDKGVLREAISSGAISARAGECERGTIYFNNGAYVDAGFEGVEMAERGGAVLETIYELFRLSMTHLPGAFGYQPQSGALAARVPAVVNLRPNKVNIELMKRLDHLRSGIVETEDEDLDTMFDRWLPEAAQTVVANGDTVSFEGVQDAEIGGDQVFVRLLSEMLEATDVTKVSELARDCFSALGITNAFVDIRVAGATGSLLESNVNMNGRVVVDECCSGAVAVQLLLEQGHSVNCPDAAKTILNAAAQRVRIMPGAVSTGRVEAPDFVAADPVSQSLLTTLRDLAALDGTSEKRKLRGVLFCGERGTGKEKLARQIHKWSGRAQGPFRAINFGAISKDLAAAELFGAKRGAYTGSVNSRTGYIQEAENGTLFLDEIDEASDGLQAMLKRVAQFGTYSIVGDPAEHTANVRFVAATNVVDIESAAIKRDLKDRFLVLRVPPLRERRGDIRPLAENFAGECGFVLPEAVLMFLERLDWPGNVRQLQNVIERSCAIANSPADLTIDLFQRSAVEDGAAAVVVSSGIGADFVPLRNGETLETRIDSEEKKHVMYALDYCNGNRTHAASFLGISRQWLIGRIKKFEL